MPTFSAGAAAVQCQTIHHRAISAAASIAETAAQWHSSDSPLIQLSTKLKQFGEAAFELGDKLSGTEPISQTLQSAVIDRLEKCDFAEGIVERGTGVSENRELPIDQDLLLKYQGWVSLETSVIQGLVEAMEMKSTGGQDKYLSDAGYRTLVGIADTAFTAVISSDTVPDGIDDEAPPPYDESTSEAVSDVKRPVPSASSPVASTSSQQAPQSTLSGIFRAMTTPFRHKPEPLVTALCEASSRGDVTTVTSLISSGANIDGRNEDGKTPLVLAIENHQHAVFNKLLELGVSKEMKDSVKKLPPLFWAASAGDVPMAKLLLQHGCSPNDKNVYGHAYFLDIIDKGDLEMVQLLLDHGAKANTTDLYLRPAIHHAYSANNLEMLKLLQSRGGSVNSRDMAGSPMVILALRENKDEIFDFLLECGANVNSKTGTGVPLIVEAFTMRRIDVVKKLLDRGADPNAKDNVGNSMLMSAVKAESKTLRVDDRKELVTSLLNHGANPNVCDSWGKSAVSFLVERGLLSLVPVLLEKGLDPNGWLSNGETLMSYAVRNNSVDLANEVARYGGRPYRR